MNKATIITVMVLLLLPAGLAYTKFVENRHVVGVYGEIHFHDETGQTLEIAAVDTYYNQMFASGCTASGINCDNYTLEILYDGLYSASYHMSFGGGANTEYHMTLGVNGVDQDNCHQARKVGTGGDVGNMGGTCVLQLHAGDSITLLVENEGSAQDITIQDSNFNLVFT